MNTEDKEYEKYVKRVLIAGAVIITLYLLMIIVLIIEVLR